MKTVKNMKLIVRDIKSRKWEVFGKMEENEEENSKLLHQTLRNLRREKKNRLKTSKVKMGEHYQMITNY